MKKVLLINLGILVAYTAIVGLATPGEQLAYAVFLMMAVGLHALINLGISIFYFVRKENEIGRIFLLSTGLVLVIGVSACFGGSYL